MMFMPLGMSRVPGRHQGRRWHHPPGIGMTDQMFLVMTLISERQRAAFLTEAGMKFRMSRILRFWIECELPDYRAKNPRTTLIAQILRAYEEAGDAMRFLNGDGRVSWKATPRMLTRLADAEREARDDLADW
jgi:hypothetical protein